MVSIALSIPEGQFRGHVISALSSNDKFHISISTNNGLDMVSELATFHQTVDVLVLDMQLRDVNVLPVIKRLRKKYTMVPILAFSSDFSDAIVMKALQNGAGCVLQKHASGSEIQHGIYEVAETGSSFSPPVTRILLRHMQEGQLAGKYVKKESIVFSSMEIRVMQLLALELKNIEISNEICRSVSAVEAIKRGIFHKTGARGTVGAVTYAIRNGLIEL